MSDEVTKPRHTRQLQQSQKPDGAADQLTGNEDIQPEVDKLKAEVSRKQPPAQPPSKKSIATYTKHQKRVCPVGATTPRQKARTPQAESRQKWGEELDGKLQQMKSELVKMMSEMLYPPAHLESIDEHLDGMLKQGVIEPASSPGLVTLSWQEKMTGACNAVLTSGKSTI